jgi:hypothetical protein
VGQGPLSHFERPYLAHKIPVHSCGSPSLTLGCSRRQPAPCFRQLGPLETLQADLVSVCLGSCIVIRARLRPRGPAQRPPALNLASSARARPCCTSTQSVYEGLTVQFVAYYCWLQGGCTLAGFLFVHEENL